MTKHAGQYTQFKPLFFINDEAVPAVNNGESFTYLWKTFDFKMDNSAIKATLVDRLRQLLQVTSNLKIRPQLKLKILRVYIPSQINFELRTYDISVTWINQHLDPMICDAVRTWLELPISTCVSEILSLPRNKAGLGVTSVKTSAGLLRLGQRYRLKHSKSKNINDLWAQSTLKNVPLDSFINATSGNCDQAKKAGFCASIFGKTGI